MAIDRDEHRLDGRRGCRVGHWRVNALPSVSFWRDQRVFLTGHTGFKGSWLALWLKQLGATVAGYALPAVGDPSLFSAADVEGAVDRSIIADIRDAAALAEAVGAFAPTVVLHLAAQPLVRLSYARPVETYSTNVMGTVNLLEAVRAAGRVGATVVVTSDKCYENRETIWPYRETDAMGGHDPYSSSKGCTELVAAAYASSFFASGDSGLATVRAGNVIGGGDWSLDRLFPDMMTAFADGRPALIRRPDAVRPWQHVIEPLSGYLLAAEHIFGRAADGARAWNFGPAAAGSVPVAEVAQLAIEAWGEATVEAQPDPNALHEATLLTLDATKAAHDLRWVPRWDLARTVDKTVSWYRDFYAGGAARALCLAQIDDYTRA